MNTSKLKLYTGLICMSLLLPSASEAYLSTNQTATRINADTALYTVTYKFGFLNRELYMPILANRQTISTDQSPFVEYSILNEDSVYSEGQTKGIVLANDKDIEIKDGQYYLPAGRNAEFTLMTILTGDGIFLNQNNQLSLKIEHLPLTMVNDGKLSNNKLNPSELQNYRTPAI